MSLDMHIWSCIRANSKYKVATTLHRKRRSSPRLPLPLGSCLGHSHHPSGHSQGQVVVYTSLCGPLYNTWRAKSSQKWMKNACFYSVFKKINILIYCYLHLTAHAKNMDRSQKNWFSREKVLANELLDFFGKLLLTPNSCCRKTSKNIVKNQLYFKFRVVRCSDKEIDDWSDDAITYIK